MGVVAILAAAWVLKQKGFFGHQVALQKKPEIKTVPTVKADSRATPEPKPSTPAPTPVLVTPPPPATATGNTPHTSGASDTHPAQSQRSLCLPQSDADASAAANGGNQPRAPCLAGCGSRQQVELV